jgi:hypothetical protein
MEQQSSYHLRIVRKCNLQRDENGQSHAEVVNGFPFICFRANWRFILPELIENVFTQNEVLGVPLSGFSDPQKPPPKTSGSSSAPLSPILKRSNCHFQLQSNLSYVLYTILAFQRGLVRVGRKCALVCFSVSTGILGL